MRIVVLPPRGVDFPAGSPWLALIDGLRGSGHDVSGFGLGEGSYDALVSMNDQPLVKSVQDAQSISPARSALIVLEPRVTSPRMYTKSRLSRYGLRYAASPLWAGSIGALTFTWPQEIGPQRQSNGPYDFAASMINGDKRSAVAGSLYGLRRRVIQSFREDCLSLGVFGPGWDASKSSKTLVAAKASAKAVMSRSVPHVGEAFGTLSVRPTSWMGTVEDKNTAFASAPVAVVIENSTDYVSEKLVDAIRGGAAPVYVGPPLSNFGLPASIAEQVPASADEVLRAVRALSNQQIGEIVAAGGEWLATREAQSHAIEQVLWNLGYSIGAQLQDR